MELSLKSFWKLVCGSFGITCFRTVSSFILHKFLAVVFGPATFACIGQFQNILSIGQGVSSLAMQNGWVSLSAKHKNETDVLHGIWRGGFRLNIFSTFFLVAIGIAFIFLAPLEEMFPEMSPRTVQTAVLFALPGIFATNVVSICLSVMNGLGRYYRYAVIALALSLLQTLWVVILVYTKTLSLLSVIATQSLLALAVALPLASRAGFSFSVIKSSLAHLNENRKVWTPFIAMGIVPMLLTPLALTFVRQMLQSSVGIEVAGLWQGVYRISDFLNVGISSVLGIVLLPKLSEKLSQSEFKKIFYPLLVRVLGIACVLCVLIFLFKEQTINLFLSEKFADASKLLPYQLLGDFFHAGGWCCGMVLIAKQCAKGFLFLEIFFQIFFVSLSFVLLSSFNAYAPVMAYAVENFLYFIFALVLVRKISWKSL